MGSVTEAITYMHYYTMNVAMVFESVTFRYTFDTDPCGKSG